MTDRKKLPRVITKEERLARFGSRRNARTRKGSPNRITQSFKEALLLAAELEGSDGKGKDGLVGYLRMHARDMPKTFLGIMQKAITPAELQVQAFQLNVNASRPADQPSNVINLLAVRGMPTEQVRDAVAALRAMTTPGAAGPFKQLGAPASRGLGRLDRSDGVTDEAIRAEIGPAIEADMKAKGATSKQIADAINARLETEIRSRFGSDSDKTIAASAKKSIMIEDAEIIEPTRKRKNGRA
jgi:hypothetical protein